MRTNEETVHTEAIGAWTVEYFAETGDGRVSWRALVSLDGAAHARLSMFKDSGSAERAVAELRLRVQAWIADYEARSHSGATGFADL